VYQLYEIPYEELLGWVSYFDARPPGWKEDDRTFKLMQAWGVKEQPEKVFPSLGVLRNKPKAEGDFDVAGFKGSLMYHKMLKAVGGDQVNL
jgi:hypothetical protein